MKKRDKTGWKQTLLVTSVALSVSGLNLVHEGAIVVGTVCLTLAVVSAVRAFSL